jgi:DNA transposition AAA+ family ATPase
LLIDNAGNLQLEALIDLKQLYEESGVPIVLIGEPDLDSNLLKAMVIQLQVMKNIARL